MTLHYLRHHIRLPLIAGLALAAMTSSGVVVIADSGDPVALTAAGPLALAVRIDTGSVPAGPLPPVGSVELVGSIQPISSNFDVSRFVDGEGDVPESSAHEPSGNFRLICEFSHFANDDPIVFPGQPGASHPHMFFGNTGADANSTYESLRTTGDGTCQGGPINRSAYWSPAVLDGQSRPVVPDFISVYYKGRGITSAGGTADVADLTPGLRMIAGAVPMDPDAPSRHEWRCEDADESSRVIPDCPAGKRVGVSLAFPRCWNGTELDASDHRSHLAYTYYDDQGRERCPSTHTIPIAELTIGIWFTHDGNSKNWYLPSDRMPGSPKHANGSSFHADWFGGWDPTVQKRWIDTCINGLLNCDGGELGDGTTLSDALEPAVGR